MADVIDYQIYGDDLQLVEIELDPGEGVRGEAGTMTYMEAGIEMETGTGGGLLKGLKRAVTGESFFITTFSNAGSEKARVGFAAPYPGKDHAPRSGLIGRQLFVPERFLSLRC